MERIAADHASQNFWNFIEQGLFDASTLGYLFAGFVAYALFTTLVRN
jgi:hypothetical protein